VVCGDTVEQIVVEVTHEGVRHHACAHKDKHTHAHTQRHTNTHMHMHMQIHTVTHTHIHHTHTLFEIHACNKCRGVIGG
jgi:hypothetical protein